MTSPTETSPMQTTAGGCVSVGFLLSGDVFPRPPVNDLPNGWLTDSELNGQFYHAYSSGVHSTDTGNIITGKRRRPARLASWPGLRMESRPVPVTHWRQASSVGVECVFARRNILKVLESVVHLYSTSMVHDNTIRLGTNEARHDEIVDLGSSPLSVEVQRNQWVPPSVETNAENSASVGSQSVGGAPHAPHVRAFVVREVGHFLPHFRREFFGAKLNLHDDLQLGLVSCSSRGANLGSGSSATLSQPVVDGRSSGV